jgi:DNA-binding transcriptional MerR regulator
MKTLTQNDLAEIKELIKDLKSETAEIKAKLTDLERKQLEETTEIKAKLTDLEKNQIEIKATLQAWKPSIDKIPDLAEKVGELKNWRQFIVILVTSIASGVVGWFLRSGKTN